MQYKDRSGTCFGFESHEVTCPADKKQIREYKNGKIYIRKRKRK